MISLLFVGTISIRILWWIAISSARGGTSSGVTRLRPVSSFTLPKSLGSVPSSASLASAITNFLLLGRTIRWAPRVLSVLEFECNTTSRAFMILQSARSYGAFRDIANGLRSTWKIPFFMVVQCDFLRQVTQYMCCSISKSSKLSHFGGWFQLSNSANATRRRKQATVIPSDSRRKHLSPLYRTLIYCSVWLGCTNTLVSASQGINN